MFVHGVHTFCHMALVLSCSVANSSLSGCSRVHNACLVTLGADRDPGSGSTGLSS